MTTIGSGSTWAQRMFISHHFADRQDAVSSVERAQAKDGRRPDAPGDRNYGLSGPYGANPIDAARREDRVREAEQAQQVDHGKPPVDGLQDAEIIAAVLNAVRSETDADSALQARIKAYAGHYGPTGGAAPIQPEPRNIFAEDVPGDDALDHSVSTPVSAGPYAAHSAVPTGKADMSRYAIARAEDAPTRLEEEALATQKANAQERVDTIVQDRRAYLDITL